MTSALVPALAFTLLAAPHGLEFTSPLDAVTQVDARFNDWLQNKGDRKATLATRAEVEANLKPLTLDAKELKKLTAQTLADMKPGKLPKHLTPTRAVIDPVPGEGSVELVFLGAEGEPACAVGFFALPNGRWVLQSGPVCLPAPPLEKVLRGKKLLFEKQNGAWAAGAQPTCPTLREAAKAVYVAEKSYFAEFDTYSADLKKVGIDEAALKAKVNVTVKGTGATASFSAEATGDGGAITVTDASSELKVTKPCGP